VLSKRSVFSTAIKLPPAAAAADVDSLCRWTTRPRRCAGLVRSRTALINTARGLTKSYGERLRGCNPRNLNPEKAQRLSPELQAALQPLLAAIESLSERIHEYTQQIEKIAKESYPQVARLEQVKGVGTLIALSLPSPRLAIAGASLLGSGASAHAPAARRESARNHREWFDPRGLRLCHLRQRGPSAGTG
jgi:hypothetical protein